MFIYSEYEWGDSAFVFALFVDFLASLFIYNALYGIYIIPSLARVSFLVQFCFVTIACLLLKFLFKMFLEFGEQYWQSDDSMGNNCTAVPESHEYYEL